MVSDDGPPTWLIAVLRELWVVLIASVGALIAWIVRHGQRISDNSERIRVLETEQKNGQVDQARVFAWLQSVDAKVDGVDSKIDRLLGASGYRRDHEDR